MTLLRKRALHKYIHTLSCMPTTTVVVAVDEAVTPLVWALRRCDWGNVDHLLPPVASLELWLRLSNAVSLIAAIARTMRMTSMSIKPDVWYPWRLRKVDKEAVMKIVQLVLLRLRPVIQARCTSVERVYVRISSWQRCSSNAGLPMATRNVIIVLASCGTMV